MAGWRDASLPQLLLRLRKGIRLFVQGKQKQQVMEEKKLPVP